MKKELDMLLIFDFDDTIVQTNIEFEKTNRKNAEIISLDIFGHKNQAKEVENRQRQIDLIMVKAHGFIPKRYKASWMETYRYFLKQKNKSSNCSTLNLLTETINDLFIRKYNNIPHSVTVIKKLKNEGYPMIILTAGEEEVQKRKIKEAGVFDYLDGVHVYSKKTPETLQEVMFQYPAKEYVMIGNSLKSDIYPALANDIWGFYIEQGAWEADLCEIDENHDKFIRLNSITEVPKRLRDIHQKVNQLVI